MDLCHLRDFFMWCTIINFALLWFSYFICAVAGGFIYRMHTRWFPLPRETFNGIIYSLLGFYKIMVIFFNLVPFIVLWII